MCLRPLLRSFVGALLLSATGLATYAQAGESLPGDLQTMVQTPAIPGYEQQLAARIAQMLGRYHPRRDSMGDVVVTLGAGAPHRLLAAPMDEPGYVVSRVDPAGYLRLQRLPQGGLPLHYNELHTAQPMLVGVAGGRSLPGSMAGLSIHLQPGRQGAPALDDIDNLYVDIGARNASEAEAAGVHLLDPVVEQRALLPIGEAEVAGRALGDRFGDAVLVDVLRHLNASELKGTLTVAFVSQQWTGARGLARVLEETTPDELIYVGRALPAPRTTGVGGIFTAQPGTGAWLVRPSAAGDALGADLAQAAVLARVRLAEEPSQGAAPPVAKGYGDPVVLPARTAHLAVATRWPLTPGETLAVPDLQAASALLQAYLQGHAAAQSIETLPPPLLPAAPVRPVSAPSAASLLQALTLSYGISEHEEQPRAAVRALLPPWARPQVDAGGNLVLDLASAVPAASPARRIVLMAHLDEIGYLVRKILPDGSLAVENKGGGLAAYYWGHPVLLQTRGGMRAGVVSLPDTFDTTSFTWPTDIRAPAQVYVGAHSPSEVASLGIAVGDTLTIAKSFRTLLGGRVSARSLDDRVGCAALVRAVWQLGPHPDLHGAQVTLVWSTREELGLFGANAFAKQAYAEHRVPQTVFAIDTFVSSDSPLESQRFADAKLGDGFVIRAVDNSNIVPTADVEALLKLARSNHIAVQYGVTGGGNDGATFLRYGATDVALGWPLRYSHSPAEVIDLRDLDALAAVAETIARHWVEVAPAAR